MIHPNIWLLFIYCYTWQRFIQGKARIALTTSPACLCSSLLTVFYESFQMKCQITQNYKETSEVKVYIWHILHISFWHIYIFCKIIDEILCLLLLYSHTNALIFEKRLIVISLTKGRIMYGVIATFVRVEVADSGCCCSVYIYFRDIITLHIITELCHTCAVPGPHAWFQKQVPKKM